MTDRNPAESLDAEGMADVEDLPPGVDVETEQEGMFAPRDEPLAAGDDPAYPVTAAEDRTVEGVAERAERETPDAGAAELDVGGGVPGTEARRAANRRATIDDPGTAEDRPGRVVGAFAAGPGSEDGAVPEIDATGPPDDETAAAPATEGRLIEDPDDGADPDDRSRLLAGGVEDDEAAPSPEEAAMKVLDDDRF